MYKITDVSKMYFTIFELNIAFRKYFVIFNTILDFKNWKLNIILLPYAVHNIERISKFVIQEFFFFSAFKVNI